MKAQGSSSTLMISFFELKKLISLYRLQSAGTITEEEEEEEVEEKQLLKHVVIMKEQKPGRHLNANCISNTSLGRGWRPYFEVPKATACPYPFFWRSMAFRDLNLGTTLFSFL